MSQIGHLSARVHLSAITPECIHTPAAKFLIRAVLDVVSRCLPKAMWQSHSVRTKPSLI